MQKSIFLPGLIRPLVHKAFTFVVLLSVFTPSEAEAIRCQQGVPCGNACISPKEVCRARSLPSEAKAPKSRAKPAVLKEAVKSEPSAAPVVKGKKPKKATKPVKEVKEEVLALEAEAPAPAVKKAAPRKLIPDLADFDGLGANLDLGDDPFPPVFSEEEMSEDQGPGFPPPASMLAASVPATAAAPTVVNASPSSRRHPESYYREQLCGPRWKGIANYGLSDGSSADCVNMQMAIRIAYADQWQEAIGQALHYGRKTGLRPAVALIIEQPQDRKFLRLLTDLRKHYSLELRILVVEDK